MRSGEELDLRSYRKERAQGEGRNARLRGRGRESERKWGSGTGVASLLSWISRGRLLQSKAVNSPGQPSVIERV